MAEIDSLEIRIESDANRASSAIDKLIGKLQGLDSALNLKNLGNISKALSGMSNAVDLSGVKNLESGLKSVAEQSNQAVQKVKRNIDSLKNSTDDYAKTVSKVTKDLANEYNIKDSGQIEKLRSGVQKLADSYKSIYEANQNNRIGNAPFDFSGLMVNAKAAQSELEKIIKDFWRVKVSADETATAIKNVLAGYSHINASQIKNAIDGEIFETSRKAINKAVGQTVFSAKGGEKINFAWMEEELAKVDAGLRNLSIEEIFQELPYILERAKTGVVSFAEAAKMSGTRVGDLRIDLSEARQELSQAGAAAAKFGNSFVQLSDAINKSNGYFTSLRDNLLAIADKAHTLDITPKFDTKNVKMLPATISTSFDEMVARAENTARNINNSLGVIHLPDLQTEGFNQIRNATEALTEELKQAGMVGDKASASMGNVAERINEVGVEASKTAEAINNMSKHVSSSANIQLLDVGIKSRTDRSPSGIGTPANATRSVDEFIAQQNRAKEAIKKTSEETEKLSENTGKISKLAKEPMSLIAGFSALGDELEKLSQLFDKLGNFGQKALSVMYAPLRAVVDEYKTKLANIGKLFDKFRARVQENLKKISAFWKRTMRTFTFMLVRKAFTAIIKYIGEATHSLAQFSREVGTVFNQRMSSAVADLKWIGKSIVGAFEPIINYVVPILDKLAAAIVRVMTLLGHFFAALTGQSYYMVAKKRIEDYAGAIEDAEKAAKKSIRPFDELNLITSGNNGNGNSGLNPMEDWDMKPVSQKMKDFADKVKDILSKIFEPMKKAWDRTKDYVIDGFRYMVSQLGKLMKDIGTDWLKVWQQEKTVKMFENILKIVGDLERVVGNLAKRFDEAWVSGKTGFMIFENIRDIFATLIEHIRNVTRYMIDWSDSINFEPLLDSVEKLTRAFVKLADFIGSVFYDVMVNVVLKYVKWMTEEGFPHLLNTITEVINAFDFEHIRRGLFIVEQAFEKMLENIHTGVTNALGNLGKAIAEWTNSASFTKFMQAIAHIMEQFTSDRVQKVLEGLGLAILHIAEALADFVSSDKFLNFIDSIGEWLDSHSAEDIANIAEKILLVVGALKALSVVSGGLGDVVKTFLMFRAFGNISKIASSMNGTPGIFARVASSMKNLGMNAATMVRELSGVGGILPQIKAVFTSSSLTATGATAGVTIGTTFVTSILTAIAGYHLGKKIGELITGEKETYKNFKILDFKELFTGDLKSDFGDMLNGVVDMLTDFENNPVIATLGNIVAAPLLSIGAQIKKLSDDGGIDALKQKFSDLKTGASESVSGIGEKFSSTWEDIKGGATLMWQDITSGLGGILDNIKGKFEPVISFFEGFKTRVGQIFNGLWIIIKSVWVTVTGWIKSNVVQPITQFFTQLWTDIKSVWNTVVTWFDTTIIQPLVQGFNNLVNSVKQFFTQLWADIQSIWSAVTTWFNTTIIQPLVQGFTNLVNNVKTFFSNLWVGIQAVWQAAYSWFMGKVITPIKNAFSSAVNYIKSAFTSLWSTIKSGVKSAFNFVVGVVEKAINGIIKGLNGFFKGFNSIVNKAAQIIGESWSGVTLIPTVSLPRFETGGFPEDGLFRASHGEIMGEFDNGQSVVANNEQIIEGIKGGVIEAMMEVMPMLAQAVGGNTTVEIQGDMGKLFKAVVKENNGVNKRTFGNSPIYNT